MRDDPSRRRGPIVIGIGASAGGIGAVAELVGALSPGVRAPILISQHMPPGTSEASLELLRRGHARPVTLAVAGTRLRPGAVYLTPAEQDLALDDRDPWLRLAPRPAVGAGPHPSVDLMFFEMARTLGRRSCVVVLSGMGRDGLLGARAVHAAGGLVGAQDRGSAAVWGMPARIIERGLADRVGPVGELAAWIDGHGGIELARGA